MPYFTIVMATRNQGEFIETAIRSVLDQGCDVDLVVYDALSDDETTKVLERYSGCLKWVREGDRGMVDAINRGLFSACGRVLAWLNSDDAYLPGALAHVKAAFEEDPGLDFVYGDALEMDREGNIFTPNLFTEDYSFPRYLHSHNYLCQPAIFFRARVLEKVGMLREDLRWTMDYEWFARFFMAGLKGRRLKRFLAANRDYADSKTNSGGLARYREMMAMHRARPGAPLFLRRSFWIYSAEAVIKGLNSYRQRVREGSIRARGTEILSKIGGRIFLRLVNPRSRKEIQERFQREILPRGRNIADQWRNAPSDPIP